MENKKHFVSKHVLWWLILVVCLTLLLTALILSAHKPAEPEKALEASSAKEENSIQKLKLGMTMAEVEAVLGEPELVTEGEEIRWSYEALNITFHRFNERASEIRALTGSSFTLDSGIGLGNREEDILDVYPQAYEVDGDPDNDKVNSWFCVDNPDDSLEIGVTNGIVSIIIWKDYGNPLLEALTVNEITLYAVGSEPIRAMDKAAKRICTILTISEPEAASMPEENPIGWMDFGDGTAVCLYEGDYAVVFRYEGTFEPILTASTHLEGIFTGLGDAFAQALQNPTETW